MIASDRGVTIVTACFDLRRRDRTDRRSVDELFEYAQWLLSSRTPIVAFVDPELAARVQETRAGFDDAGPLLVIERPFEDLPHHADVESVQETLAAGRRPPTMTNLAKDTARFAVLGWSKPGFLAEVAAADPFGSNHLWWLDFGLAHVARPHPDLGGDELLELATAPLHCSVVRETSRAEIADRHIWYRHNAWARVAGGLFGGTPDRLTTLHQWFESELARVLHAGWPALEETILGAVVTDHREDFTVSHATHAALLENLLEPRADAWHLLATLTVLREQERHQEGAQLALRMETGWHRGQLPLTDDEVAQLYDELLVLAWYADRIDDSRRAADALVALGQTTLPDSSTGAHIRSERVRGNLALHGLSLDDP